jgi:hypothetical protein
MRKDSVLISGYGVDGPMSVSVMGFDVPGAGTGGVMVAPIARCATPARFRD